MTLREALLSKAFFSLIAKLTEHEFTMRSRMNLKIHLHLQSQGTATECFDLVHVTCNIHAVVGYDVNAHFSGCNQKIRCCASRTQ